MGEGYAMRTAAGHTYEMENPFWCTHWGTLLPVQTTGQKRNHGENTDIPELLAWCIPSISSYSGKCRRTNMTVCWKQSKCRNVAAFGPTLNYPFHWGLNVVTDQTLTTLCFSWDRGSTWDQKKFQTCSLTVSGLLYPSPSTCTQIMPHENHADVPSLFPLLFPRTLYGRKQLDNWGEGGRWLKSMPACFTTHVLHDILGGEVNRRFYKPRKGNWECSEIVQL